MISLFLTVLLGLFCCSSVNINTLDHTKEIEVRENINTKRILDSNGVYLMPLSNMSAESSCNYWIAFFKRVFPTTQSLFVDGVPYDQNNITPEIFTWTDRTYDFGLVKNMGDYMSSTSSVNLFTTITSIDFVTRKNDVNNDFFRRVVIMHFDDDTFRQINYYCWYPYKIIDGVTISDFDGKFIFTTEILQGVNGGNGSYLNDNDEAIRYDESSYFYEIFHDESVITDEAYQQGYNSGYQVGFNDGLNNYDYDETALTIFTGFIEVGLLPVNVFLTILNFEVFGINIAGLVSSLLTIAIVIIIIRFLLGGKESD